MFEKLEMRRLLSVSTAFDAKAGMFYVLGSAEPEIIEVHLEAVTPQISKFLTGAREQATQVTVYEGNKMLFSQRMPSLELKMALVNGGGGDDIITLYNSSTTTVDLMGGDGDDTIESNALGRAPGSAIYGDAGNDFLVARSGKGSVAGHFIEGGEGDDFIFGSEFNDWLYGDVCYKLTLEEVAGNDFIYAGAGDDSLWGGAGDDALYGEDGNDLIYAGSGADKVSGGEGKDSGVLDSWDTYGEDLELVIFVK